MKKLTLFIALSLATTSFVGCKKVEGPAGQDGKDGNANVVSSVVYSEPTNWSFINPSWFLNITYPAITQDIIDKGAVLVYMRSNSSPETFTQLPFTFFESSTYSSVYNLEVSLGAVRIIRTDSDQIQPDTPGYDKIKIVVIAASGLAKNPNVDLSNYEEVKEVFGL